MGEEKNKKLDHLKDLDSQEKAAPNTLLNQSAKQESLICGFCVHDFSLDLMMEQDEKSGEQQS